MAGKPPPEPAEPALERDLRPSVAERVAIIRRELLARRWGPAVAAELAVAWDVSDVLVRHHASEAQRQIEAAADVALERAQVHVLLLEAADAARLEPRPAEAARALVAVAEARRKLAGIGEHKDPRSDPKPAAEQPDPGAPARVPVGFKRKPQDKPS